MRQIISLLCTLFLLGCVSNGSEITPSQFDREFFRLSTAEQVKKFQGYNPDTQYELLIVGNQVVHPPALYLAEEFAKQGKSIIPFLRSKLAATKQESTVRDVVAVLAEMQRLGSYEVKCDASLMAFVEERVAGMQGQWKAATRHMLEEIQGQPKR
ncbi:hypothetical protein [Ralstonia solanacearum]|uniref:Lipoprotein n=1 Tax=Ralstonia solanacearum CFBP2957 TaxID=859656 RepID=D8P2Z9_RALSL|nr:hypothetical protein [Ralstonia solanacearum]CBJ53285.1 exported protein of unknown function [Ralstonia solanacearum CFBP2957]